MAEMPLERENGIVIKEDQEVIVKLAAAEAAAEKKCSESGTCSLPPTQHLKIRVMFDITYKILSRQIDLISFQSYTKGGI